MEYPQIDLNNVCRTCKNESAEMKSLYCRDSESSNETPRLDEMLMACAIVQVNNEDGLPKSICPSCFVQLKNAYSFKEQCEKTDLFLQNYLKILKKESIKKEIMTDLEITSNFISEINLSLKDFDEKDDKGIENIKEDPESHSRESHLKDVDYVQTIQESGTCSKVFSALKDLRYHKMYFEDNTSTFSDQSDGIGGDGLVGVEETIKSVVEVSESNDQERIDKIEQITNEIYGEQDPLQMLMKTEIEEELYKVVDEAETKEDEADVNNINEYESDASTHSETIPTKQAPPKIKRGRGRPRKHPVSFKPTGKPRDRPLLLKLKIKLPKNKIGNIRCPQCEEVFTKMSLLDKHAEQHAGLRIHECDSCNKKFSKWNNLTRHKLLHVEAKPFRCMTCSKCFTRRGRLQKHMEVHLSAKAHSCDLCREVFYRLGNLAKHKALKHNITEKIMREKKNFLCSECGQRFIRNQDLVVHMRRHRGEKPFKCKFCGKGFPRTTDLAVHERYHTGEKTHLCVTCGRGFGRAYNLTVHMRTHTGEKPYRCTYCDAAFAQGNDLKAHVRKHTGERFQCELCPKAYLIRNVLTQHQRLVHGLNIVGNQRKLQPINKLNPDNSSPITVSDPLQSQQIEVSELKEQGSDIM